MQEGNNASGFTGLSGGLREQDGDFGFISRMAYGGVVPPMIFMIRGAANYGIRTTECFRQWLIKMWDFPFGVSRINFS